MPLAPLKDPWRQASMVDRNHRAANDEVSKLARLRIRQITFIISRIANVSENNLHHVL